jgi:cbb3-type cytochrome oxidase subunit 3
MWHVASSNRIILAVALIVGLAVAFWAFRRRRGGESDNL